ncbi:16S rRNA-processing protein RimM [Listeria fleischmannii 1991]|jgi:16S rRNA processing protein RimM|uniref:Ribosome maturation factor RimM n=3 Tax=Listeria fleischmannii TaxID=1069827 RepID=A0A2X3GRT0_9LIST|nr:ribosome maturation factor RimM [Listeria fleischmannii]EMG27010.1 16S rRNA-processing protein RimM [Listeria fleischmannii subsp. fleischmannii LU2006-1]KMT57964.1 16S rRNA-processing protein RimM [Listeria fleischmannii 1991]MBC1399535.1 ribosome maturation factor RimM [Listeria fleischmannii]MBC1418870.1 ribosome maturation factor RimM [Listeria fleischmannii]MBC1428246.1 ribosome maturation factor RimM [Listeria fleischmannii]
MGKMFNVGKIVNTHGLMGEVRVISRTDFADERYRVGNKLFLYLKNENTPIELTIRSHRVHKNFDLLTFEGYNGINQVEKMKEGILKVPEEALSELEENAYYFHEIIGCNVRTLDGLVLGEITEILTPGANDVWVVKPERGKEMLIPYIADVVKKIDIANKDIVIEPLEGLLD